MSGLSIGRLWLPRTVVARVVHRGPLASHRGSPRPANVRNGLKSDIRFRHGFVVATWTWDLRLNARSHWPNPASTAAFRKSSGICRSRIDPRWKRTSLGRRRGESLFFSAARRGSLPSSQRLGGNLTLAPRLKPPTRGYVFARCSAARTRIIVAGAHRQQPWCAGKRGCCVATQEGH